MKIKEIIQRKIRKFLNSKGYFHRSQVIPDDMRIAEVLKETIADSPNRQPGQLSAADQITILICEADPIRFFTDEDLDKINQK